MSNMSYCRFENTAKDLDDCKDALERLFLCETEERGDTVALSRREIKKAKELIETCYDILEMVAEQNPECEMEDLSDGRTIENVLDDAQAMAIKADQERDEEEERA
jgi:hypothetical protein